MKLYQRVRLLSEEGLETLEYTMIASLIACAAALAYPILGPPLAELLISSSQAEEPGAGGSGKDNNGCGDGVGGGRGGGCQK